MTSQAPEVTPKRLFSYGVSLRPPRGANDSFLGPSSLYYFTTRMVKPLSVVIQQASYPDSLVARYEGNNPESSSAIFSNPALGGTCKQVAGSQQAEDWTPMQEQYFTDRYWQSLHTSVMPILDEAEFKEHHQALWTSVSADGSRQPSALVDIVIALCMQLGLPAGEADQLQSETDTTMAGQRYYRRAQSLLTYEMESPSLATLQCYLLCSIYVCAGSFHNMVDMMLGLAVRTAYVLGLHLDPPASLPRKEREMRRRLWWATYMLETKISAKLGRPFSIDDSFVLPELPSDDKEAALLAGSTFAPIGANETWLSFNRHIVGLYQVIREAHITFSGFCAASTGDQNIWRDPDTLESCAESLLAGTHRLAEWRDSVPLSLRMKRRGGHESLSTHASDVIVETFSPIWHQRQCLLLELTYHHLRTNMYRPLISFSARPKPGAYAEELANNCALHAMAYTRILHQVLTRMKILETWNETFHWQWNSVLTLVGFVLAAPPGPRPQIVTDARCAIDLAKVSCDIYAEKFSIARKASQSIQELMQKVDLILDSRARELQQVSPIEEVASLTMNAATVGSMNPGMLEPPLTGEDYTMLSDESLHDTVLSIDFWEGMDVWWPNLGVQIADPSVGIV